VCTNRSQQPRRVQHRRPDPSTLANSAKQKEKTRQGVSSKNGDRTKEKARC
jgi:hypothetical protein